MRGLPRMGAWRESVCRASPAPTWPVAALRGCGARSAWGGVVGKRVPGKPGTYMARNRLAWMRGLLRMGRRERPCRASPAPKWPVAALGGCGACLALGASGKAVPGKPGTYMVRSRLGWMRGLPRMRAWRESVCGASPAPTWSATAFRGCVACPAWAAFRRCGACPACGSCRACAARQAAGFQPTLPPASTMACSILPASTGPRNWWATLPSGAIR